MLSIARRLAPFEVPLIGINQGRLGFLTDIPLARMEEAVGQILEGQGLKLLWILAAVTMTLGNVLALLQDNLKRLMAYSGIAHAGYMLVALASAPDLSRADSATSGVAALLFYLVAYGTMTFGFFAVLLMLHRPERPVETVDDLAGLARGLRSSAANEIGRAGERLSPRQLHDCGLMSSSEPSS